ncbi:hypothetical protein EYF80_055736 [Liparis tanakae]|uniref:Uncharacterized protein n=1 Tax=Liparis tanakae TaxID=230148 RepID=A0A4Z2EYQ0_9TELE|nr:hypothetical protein EYF80_055736 [Liparis tanakae]
MSHGGKQLHVTNCWRLEGPCPTEGSSSMSPTGRDSDRSCHRDRDTRAWRGGRKEGKRKEGKEGKSEG